MISDAVADVLDLAEQVRVEQHGDAAAAQLLEQVAHGAPARPGPARSSARRAAAAAASRPAPGRSRGAAACPWTSSPRGAPRSSASPTSSSSSRALGRAARRARQPLVQREHLVGACTSRGSGRARPGSRARGARLGEPAGAPQTATLAGARAHEPAGDLRQRRLARAVGPEQADQLALADLEVDAAQRLRRAVALVQPGRRAASMPGQQAGSARAPQTAVTPSRQVIFLPSA